MHWVERAKGRESEVVAVAIDISITTEGRWAVVAVAIDGR